MAVNTVQPAAPGASVGGQQGGGLAPFRFNTRQRFARVGAQAFAAGAKVSQELPRVGLLSEVLVSVRGVVTLSGAGAIANLGPWNLINRLQLNINIGSATIFDTTGWGNFVLSHVQRQAFKHDAPGIGNTTPDADFYAAPVAMGANTWALHYHIPVSANDGRNFSMGLLNLQAPEVRATVDILWGALLDPATLITANATSANIYYMYYEGPDPRVIELPPLVTHRILEERLSYATTGDIFYTVPRQGTLLQLLKTVRANALRINTIDGQYLRFNKTDVPYNMERWAAKYYWKKRYASDPPTGAFAWDLWNTEGDVSQGDMRDAVDTEGLSTLEDATTITSGTALGTDATIDEIRRFVQVLQQ